MEFGILNCLQNWTKKQVSGILGSMNLWKTWVKVVDVISSIQRTFADDVHEMPVPSSYNDITTNSTIRWNDDNDDTNEAHDNDDARDYVGWAWYDTTFYVYPGWQDQRVMIMFGSAHYTAMVYLNGEFVVSHAGGHLPFEADVTDVLKYSAKV